MIKIREITDDGLDLKLPLGRALLADALDGLEADRDRSHCDATLHLTRTEDNVFLDGKLSGELMMSCVRCLKEVKARVEAPLRMIFTPEGEEPDEDDAAAIDKGLEHGTHDGKQLAVEETLREALILAVPLHPLCSPSCKGLCPVCGVDRNLTSCACVVTLELEDPRLAPLKGIKL